MYKKITLTMILGLFLINQSMLCSQEASKQNVRNLDQRIVAGLKLVGGFALLGLGAYCYSKGGNDFYIDDSWMSKAMEVGAMTAGSSAMLSGVSDIVPDDFAETKVRIKYMSCVPGYIGCAGMTVGFVGKNIDFVLSAFAKKDAVKMALSAFGGVVIIGGATSLVSDDWRRNAAWDYMARKQAQQEKQEKN